MSYGPESATTFPEVAPIRPPVMGVGGGEDTGGTRLILEYGGNKFPECMLGRLGVFMPINGSVGVIAPMGWTLMSISGPAMCV